ncbi:DNA-protecting protein DprA [Arthrobacter sp. MYb211]|uniref:DNA-processing protein DprA n=1 Tax=unclassified Arthrobacter TaxID=235627 RepID=UPI000CFD5120|nr:MULTISPECIES: DNA-processing protein DprA [unclassified Arthrobacter]PRA06877.1 DNA-protecting protein DprA [Arthrobacter sp. MYb229]PRA14017.1 DNA-protecting protein DprA [Arthrobacter sp. MYb221]PRB53779.1 DNA-protecting protein DprA [Arthrobacter sp. MYb216]PRC06628.1 DNA-protecting protein DprA [Arthrobacter sp. MYb211]
MHCSYTPEQLCLAELNTLIEPNDYACNGLLQLMSPAELVRLIRREDHVPGGLATALAEVLGQGASGSRTMSLPVALTRWRKRLGFSNPLDALDRISALNGGLLTPTDAAWPDQLDELGLGKPLCLWWRTRRPQLLAVQEAQRCISIVGSRDSSDYGHQITSELARKLALRGFTIVSGGAYGIDASAHRAALSVTDLEAPSYPTITILAGGADRPYPAGNETLLGQIIDTGLLLSEVPPGTAPTRFRFLNRNRLIAAISRLTLVTEARHRSGALNTASHAVDLGRDVAAVPGSVYSPNSAGTHRLLAAGTAALVTSAADVLELIGVPAEPIPPAPETVDAQDARPTDGLSRPQSMIYDVMNFVQGNVPDEISALSGIPILDTLRALSALERLGKVESNGARWRLVRRGSVSAKNAVN